MYYIAVPPLNYQSWQLITKKKLYSNLICQETKVCFIISWTETTWSVPGRDQTKMPAEDQRTGGTEDSGGFSQSMF